MAKIVSFSVSDGLYTELTALKDKLHTSKSQIIRMALKKYMIQKRYENGVQ